MEKNETNQQHDLKEKLPGCDPEDVVTCPVCGEKVDVGFTETFGWCPKCDALAEK